MHILTRYLTFAVFLAVCRLATASETKAAWPLITLAEAKQVQLAGPLAETFERGVARLAGEPYTLDWLLADVSFKVGRIFTNYIGDVSGRFLELAVLTSPPGRLSPPTLAPALAEVANYQRADGHFGAEMDLSLRLTNNSPPIPMLWGNARLLVGLATAARELNEPKLLAAAKRLGDYYVNTAGQLCSNNREAEYHSSGTYGDGYTCCYFPGMEGLTMLYRMTKDERYLLQARRMAERFWKFDALPVDHSHGNLCAWRSVLELYDLTGERTFLDRARAKWDAAVKGGFVWPLGGVGEHWYVSFGGDEGCSESDWLRFSLDLWKFTGQTRYLDIAERLLENQYAANQCGNGGFGYRELDSDPAGPMATHGSTREWPFCCSFHGPLGLHFLRTRCHSPRRFAAAKPTTLLPSAAEAASPFLSMEKRSTSKAMLDSCAAQLASASPHRRNRGGFRTLRCGSYEIHQNVLLTFMLSQWCHVLASSKRKLQLAPRPRRRTIHTASPT